MGLIAIFNVLSSPVGLLSFSLAEWGVLEAIDRLNFEAPEEARKYYEEGLITDIVL